MDLALREEIKQLFLKSVDMGSACADDPMSWVLNTSMFKAYLRFIANRRPVRICRAAVPAREKPVSDDER